MFQKTYVFLTALIITVSISGASAQCNTVDAVTTASFKITGGKACDTYADLNWTFTKSNGQLTIEWGTTTTYGTSKSVYSAKPVNLPNLQPDTKYYYHVYGVYKNNTHQYTTSSFTTSSGAAANNPPIITSTPAVICTTGKTTTYILTATDPDNDPVTFSIGSKPEWVTLASPVLTMIPAPRSVNTTLEIFASDGKGGLDTLFLAVTIPSTTVKTGTAAPNQSFRFGTYQVFFPHTVERLVTVSLYSLNGAAIMQRTIPLDALGMQSQPPGIVPGIYLLQLKNSTRSNMYTINIRE